LNFNDFCELYTEIAMGHHIVFYSLCYTASNMVLKENHRPHRGNSTAKLLVILTILLFLILGGRIWYVNAQNQTDSNGQKPGEVVAVSVANFDQTTWRKLRDQDNTFEVKYSSKIFKRISRQLASPLPSQEKLTAVSLIHSISVQHCGLSGRPEHCTPTTTDMAIDFFTVARNFNDVFKDIQKIYGQNMPVVTIDGHQGVRFSIGAEGEGIIYTVLPVNNGKTLFIARSYMDEGFISKYQGIEDFIKYDSQKTLFDQIISTFVFRPSI
jgi:hypothetical protein